MKNRKILVVANWKMNPDTVREAKEIYNGIKSVVKNSKNTKVVVCPPFVYLSDLEKIKGDYPYLGAQDMFWENGGSYTGEISPGMLRGEKYVIIGHSERRALGETDEMVSKKILTAIMNGLTPILCIGEQERDDHGEYLHFLRSELINSIGKLPKKLFTKLIVAYEPIWAIGKRERDAMRPTDIHETSIFIKKILTEICDKKMPFSVPILYGGSVNHKNAKEIITLGEVQGLLVGRASLDSEKFGELLKSLE